MITRPVNVSWMDFEPPACDCNECKGYCDRPGWMTPDEARRAIQAGAGDQLMLDYWENGGYNTYLLCPANTGSESQVADEWPVGKCTFLMQDGHCAIHDSGYKPLECRLARHDYVSGVNVHKEVYLLWGEDEPQALVRQWAKERGINL